MRTQLAAAATLPLLLAGCTAGGWNPATWWGGEEAAAAPAAGTTAFSQALANEYRQFARSEYQQLDTLDSGAFAAKARMAEAGRIPAPEDPRNRGVGTGLQLNPDIDIGTEQRAEAIQGRERLIQALQGGAAERAPQAAARAQVAYDCWVEQLEEGWQRTDIERCRRAFYTALERAAAQPVAAVPPVPADEAGYQVFFGFDSASLTPEGRRIVAAAAQQATARAAPGEVTITGYADRSGPDGYNLQLSERRAEAVKDVLVAQGIPADHIRTTARGEANPVVPTEDGVQQPQNRRAVVDFD
ncbi:MAG: OmpA family protein [Magnetospirillum sp.]|nr:OmpA family protein [Magnetospirillum sp.]